MKSAPLPPTEIKRLQALLDLDILDSEFETSYDELVRLTALVCGTPIALISLVDDKRQWFKAVQGLKVRETSRDLAFCAWTILQKDAFVVPDATQDDRFHDNPLVTDDPSIRFYAGFPLITADGQALGSLCAIDRIPRVLTADQQETLRILAGQVVRLLELRLSNLRLKQLNQDKARVFAIIAHDLRSPFNSLLNLTDLLGKNWRDSPEETELIMNELKLSAGFSIRLVNNLLKWADLETGGLKPRPESVALEGVAAEIAAEMSGSLLAKNQTFVRKNLGTVKVKADPVMLHSVLGNLIGNAIKFTPEGGAITLAAQVRGKQVWLTVADTGKGIDEDRLTNFRAGLFPETTRGTAGEKGSGLGLRLVAKFLDLHGSRLEVDSVPGQGTEFRFRLPLSPDAL